MGYFIHFYYPGAITLNPESFSNLKLHPNLLKNLDSLGYKTMTPIQAQSLPFILEGRDVIAQGKTGSGKTAAFGLGVLNKLDVKKFRIQTLILCPTRELADQVATELRKLARAIHNIKILTLCGGMPIGPQIGSLEHGAHIIVGTPGRIEDHLRKGTLSLEHVDSFILDEADRMLDMGFQDSLENILQHVPQKRQTLLFSATFPAQIREIADGIMHQPEMIKVESQHHHSSIRQQFYKVADNKQRLVALKLLLLKYQPESALVFCNTKKETQDVAHELRQDGFFALALHGDLEQKDRDRTLVLFSNKSTSILVATDVAARGLDIEDLDAVINYHVTRDSEVHVHRIGRTGRAGKKGLACSIYTENEAYKLAKIDSDVDPIQDTSNLPDYDLLQTKPKKSAMTTIQIDGGKKQKVRPGDILGCLTGENGIAGKQVGKIHVFDNSAFVAVSRDAAKPALNKISQGKLKGRNFRARLVYK
ncbi:ATP-dependent RNA helicase DbpA [Teredinibacter sp. KSP-S5-2]|uniref:ATP-dependent RNA helicase DbpA n=1 Tax=Teredinibacter sp. KSP-S5-2 TaxID=3034506 RepID=UPI002934EBDE|nr:ATP-dependent RNA helicase DbpA [Teredinibacter sp. KSP-S5-2]WNO07938.1 ATP-dependent RNA helicase DbpA [Teredinibacter sp. KSP-S5-2]